MHLAREDRIAVESEYLRALDFAVPIRAFHQSHWHAPATLARERREPVDDGERPLLVSLHGQPEAVPAAEAAIAPGSRKDFER